VGLAGSLATKWGRKDHPWVPGRRRKEWALDDYFDKLDYLKSARLYDKYNTLAKKDGIDVQGMMSQFDRDADTRKMEQQFLNREKKKLVLKGMSRKDPQIQALNERLKLIAGETTFTDLPENAAKAVAYKKAMEHTMYGFPDDDYNIGEKLFTLPRKHRQLISDVMQHGTEKERKRMYSLLPEAEQRIIGRQLNPEATPEARENLVKYFQGHFLPKEDWKGWDEDQSMEPAMAKEIQRTGLDPREVGPIFHQQYRSGLKHPLAVGPFDQARMSDPGAVRSALRSVLGPFVRDSFVDVIVEPSARGGGSVAMHIQHDRNQDVSDYLNRDNRSIA